MDEYFVLVKNNINCILNFGPYSNYKEARNKIKELKEVSNYSEIKLVKTIITL